MGPGVADEALALGVLITLPDILNRLELKLDSDLVLLCSTRAHGRGDFGGIRHFMEKRGREIDLAVNLIGVPLGTVNYFSLSRARCDISCEMEWIQGSPWGQMTNTSAVMVINEIMNKLFSIPLPRQPKTVINVGMVSGGERYSTVSNRASLNIEILSEDDHIMEELIEQVEDGCIDVGAKHGVEVSTEFFGRHKAAGLIHSHPLVKTAVRIVDHLGYRPLIQYSNSELAVPLARSIPALNLGITTGATTGATKRDVDIAPIPTGVLQIIMLLHAIDKGYCDE
jgi:di/tripeptidase